MKIVSLRYWKFYFALYKSFFISNVKTIVMLKLLPFDMFSSSYSKYKYQNKLATEVPIVADTSLFVIFIESLSLSVCTK